MIREEMMLNIGTCVLELDSLNIPQHLMFNVKNVLFIISFNIISHDLVRYMILSAKVCYTFQLIPSSLSLPANALMFSDNVLTMSPVLVQ